MRERSDSFDDAETEKLTRPAPPLLTPTGSLSPIVVRASGVPSGPWAFALIVLGGVATFLVFMIGLEPRRTPAPAHDAGAKPRSAAWRARSQPGPFAATRPTPSAA